MNAALIERISSSSKSSDGGQFLGLNEAAAAA
jgi:hypothetical protein